LDERLITQITLAESTVGPLVATTDHERAARQARQAHLQQAESDFDALPFDASAVRAFGRVTASLRQAWRKTSARSSDAMIAAIASRLHCRCPRAARMPSPASTDSTWSPFLDRPAESRQAMIHEGSAMSSQWVKDSDPLMVMGQGL
jgi:hypothetical protein